MVSNIRKHIKDHSLLIEALENDQSLMESLAAAIECLSEKLSAGHKIHLCGNGGSSADAEHIAAELSGKFKLNRKALPAEALHVNLAALTAISNDYGYENVFSRLLEAKADLSDVLIVYTTSGKSPNILKAIQKARELQCVVICFTGSYTKELECFSDIIISVPHTDTARIQEAHILLSHILCEELELKLFDE